MLGHTEEVALRVGHRRPLHVGVLVEDIPASCRAGRQQPVDLTASRSPGHRQIEVDREAVGARPVSGWKNMANPPGPGGGR